LTPGFAPLEQYDEQARRGEFTDVYGLAATYYCLVTGKMPPAAFMRVVRDTLKPPQEVNSQIAVSDVASGAMLAGLQVQAEDRPQSVSEWLGLFDDDLSLERGVDAGNETTLGQKGKDLPMWRRGKLSPVDTDDLSSERGVDYRQLRDLLKVCDWKEADKETAICMLKAAEHEKRGYLLEEDIDNFPCTDLRTIDRLWVKYSNSRFGFSAQRPIYQELGGTKKYSRKIFEAFGDRVGWRQKGEWLDYDDLTWNQECETTPSGHLPFGGEGERDMVDWFGRLAFSLAQRLVTCSID